MTAQEMVCPLCNRPRPRGVTKCVCNYTFEYDDEPRARRGSSRAAAAGLAPILLVVALVAGGVAASLVPADGEHANVGYFLIPAGLFSLAGAMFDWSWFFGSSRARRFVFLFGRTGARVVYALIGGGLAGAGVGLSL